MHRSLICRAVSALLVVLSVGASVHADPAGSGLAGHWVLAEQTYGEGRSNLAKRIPDIRFDVAVELGQARITVRTAGKAHHGAPWPAVIAEGISADLEVLEKTIHLASGVMRAHYKILPPTVDGLTLDIVEEYSLRTGDDTLDGTVTVEMSRHGEPRGGFVLHRRFVRGSR